MGDEREIPRAGGELPERPSGEKILIGFPEGSTT
jgi:hypothetical protein